MRRRGVDGDLVGPGPQERAAVGDLAHAAADAERHEADLGGALDDLEDGAADLVAGGDVQEHQLVGAGLVIGPRLGHRIAGVAQIDEADALDHPAALDIEAGDDPHLEHHAAAASSAARGSIAPA